MVTDYSHFSDNDNVSKDFAKKRRKKDERPKKSEVKQGADMFDDDL